MGEGMDRLEELLLARAKIAELEADYKELAEAKPDWDKISYKERLQRANEHYRKYRKQKKEEYKAKIAELEENLHETIQLLHGSQADAIREMLVNMKDLHYDPAMLVIQDVKEYADSLEKSDD